MPESEDLREGIVIRAGAGNVRVAQEGRIWHCRMRGRLKQGPREEQSLAVAGDRVRFGVQDAAADPPTGVVEEVLPRRNRISRQASRRTGGQVEQVLMANLDQVLAVQSLRDPAPQTGFIDRLLAAAERFGVQGILVLNKVDLVPAAARDDRWDYFRGLGYQVLPASAETGEGLEPLRDLMAGRISLLLGASGVGKSSLLNALHPGLRLRVDEVTEKTGLGRHTTTRTELFPLPGGGFIADSPGIRGFDPWDIDPAEVRDYFPDFDLDPWACRYRTCQHRDEPACGVKEAVARGRIPGWRYEAYLALVRDLTDRRERGPRRS